MLATVPLAGCELVGDIFQAGMWVGAIFIVLIIATSASSRRRSGADGRGGC